MPHKSNWVTAISYAIRPDHAHEIAASPCQQSRPDDHVIVFAAFQRVESGTCFAEPEMLHRVLVRANLPGICTEAKSKESSAFMEPHRTIGFAQVMSMCCSSETGRSLLALQRFVAIAKPNDVILADSVAGPWLLAGSVPFWDAPPFKPGIDARS